MNGLSQPSSDKVHDESRRHPGGWGSPKLSTRDWITILEAQTRAANDIRRGLCLLNAGRYDEAVTAFSRADRAGSKDKSLPTYLAACLLGRGHPDAAAEQFARLPDNDGAGSVARIRQALSRSAAGKPDEAIEILRTAVRTHPNCAELHFQLGTLLASVGRYEEAELRFTQAVTIDRSHGEAMVNLALCCGLRGAPAEAVSILQRAQTQRPWDARVGLLLAQAAKAMQAKGLAVRVQTSMPEVESSPDPHELEELSRLIEVEPDFLDAFLSIPAGDVDERVFAMLLTTLEAALERVPKHAELHYHCGQLLARLGRRDDAIAETEWAVRLDPTLTRALIDLGKLYQATERTADATTRFEQAIAAGAEYPDVYLLLGNLYHRQGFVGRARSAYRRALSLNGRYEAAQQALAALPA
jgi:tetratricopeptide (TPR) repeat protein